MKFSPRVTQFKPCDFVSLLWDNDDINDDDDDDDDDDDNEDDERDNSNDNDIIGISLNLTKTELNL